ncbi:DUF6879 family protein [Nocardia sp. NPDC059180]|uniref:DUF6879 family protein n=1 Tax=Nocardia sp. NPDC059180 TaxID=3346761 RepID=UPI0036ADEF75
MRHLSFDDLAHAFRHHRRAFHLEVRDDYSGVAGESDRVRRFLAGEPQDPKASASWHTLMREVTAAGCAVQRVRLIAEPPGEYARFSLATTAANLEVGEEIRWLPRQHAPPDLPDDDWWLFDDDMAAYTVFTGDGAALPGWVTTTDPAIVAHYARRRDDLWGKAIPHTAYPT